eukprot:gene2811-3494_t
MTPLDYIKQNSLESLKLKEVLSRIISEERSSRGMTKDDETLIPIIIHLDDYQCFLDILKGYIKNEKKSREYLKNLLQEIGDCMVNNYNPKYFIIPICSGTSSYEIDILPDQF